MKYDCDMVRDLLPLYHDGVCSTASKSIVEEHVAECLLCREELKRLGNDFVDLRLQQERTDVVAHHAQHVNKEVKKKSVAVGTVSAAVFAVPILVCLIVNLATSHALDWFFIVLASLIVVASITVVPMLAPPRRKALWTVGIFTLTLHLLLLTVCLYTGGDWFWVVSMAVLLGMTILVLPFVIHQKPMPPEWMRHKGLLVMILATGLLFALLSAVGKYVGGRYIAEAVYGRNALLIAAVCLPLPWVIFTVCRYVPVTKRGKTGLCLLVIGLFSAVINDLINWILEGGAFVFRTFHVDYLHWTADNVSANINLPVGIGLVALGLFFLLIRGKRKQ